MSDFDWYISPSDRFNYENQFDKASTNDQDVSLNQVEDIFQLSRLTQDEFLQIWNLVDIKGDQRLNKEQFIYLLHILMSRRRGRPLPTGLPLTAKESFLKQESAPSSRIYVRPTTNERSISDLEKQHSTLSLEYTQLEQDLENAESELSRLSSSHVELKQLLDYKTMYASRLQQQLDQTLSFSSSSSSSQPDIHIMLKELDAHKAAWQDIKTGLLI